MRKIVLLSIVLSLFFLACHKDGVYNPKEKIKRIYIQWPSEKDETKDLLEEWTWDDKLLTKIEHFEREDPWYKRFIYEKKRLVRIETSEGTYFNIKYDGRHYDSMEGFYPDGRTALIMKFTHENNKISKMGTKIYLYDDEFEKKSKNDVTSVLEPFFPAEFTQSLKKIKSNMKNKGVYIGESTVIFTYDGDNLKEIKSEGEDSEGGSWKIKHTYIKHDKKSNPKYRFIFGHDERAHDIGVASKNNPLEVKCSWQEITIDDEGTHTYTESCVTTNDYKYSGKFPVEVKKTVRCEGDEYDYYQYTIFYEYE
ncbi:MAG TPA: hypothetical protein GXZ40_06935 [Bacteroidales bacterium]|jgi:hypothetical protein|nr:hypothetical protein [Bacteroidales bacterium]